MASVAKVHVAMGMMRDQQEGMLEVMAPVELENMVFVATVVMTQIQERYKDSIWDRCLELRVSMGVIVDVVVTVIVTSEWVGEAQSCCLMSAVILEERSAPTQSTQLDLTNPKSMEEEGRSNTRKGRG